VLWQHEHFDAARRPEFSSNEARAFEGENHLVDRRRRDAEAALDVGFGGRPEVDARVGVDEGKILTLGGA
jgi:hypothetical protein